LCILLFALSFPGCRAPAPLTSIRVVDFIREFDRAEKRPPAGYTIGDHYAFDEHRPGILGPAPGRLIWVLPLPRRGLFQAAVAVDGASAVRFRIGVSDDRIYEELAGVTLDAGSRWTDLRADLSAYAGWKWSLFYRPERIAWRVVLSADAVAGVPGRAVWGTPEIVTDTAAAREYAIRRRTMIAVTRNAAP
jgi:hypothetical protein